LKIQDWQLSPHLVEVFWREQQCALFNVFGDRLYAALSRAASPYATQEFQRTVIESHDSLIGKAAKSIPEPR
jgi:hypothetical protein